MLSRNGRAIKPRQYPRPTTARQVPADGQPALHTEHLDDLRKSGLTDATIAAAGLYSRNAKELVFPYQREPDGFARIKFFPPRSMADGHTQKYGQPADSGVRLYVPPSVVPQL